MRHPQGNGNWTGRRTGGEKRGSGGRGRGGGYNVGEEEEEAAAADAEEEGCASISSGGASRWATRPVKQRGTELQTSFVFF